MRIILCDDDKDFLNSFEYKLREIFSYYKYNTEIVCCNSSDELFFEINKYPPDVLFLDIDMPNQNGFDIAARLFKAENKPIIIFTTGIESLVFESFNYEPLWYLLKNNMNQLPLVVDKIIIKLETSKKDFKIQISGIMYRFLLSDILYLESNNHYINLHTQDETYKFRGKLSEIEKQINSKYFIRCHASFLVNCQCIKAVGKNILILPNNISIPISRNKLFETQNCFMNYKGSLRL